MSVCLREFKLKVSSEGKKVFERVGNSERLIKLERISETDRKIESEHCSGEVQSKCKKVFGEE